VFKEDVLHRAAGHVRPDERATALLRWDKPCGNPFYTRLDARDAGGVVALVDCLTQPGEIIVSVRDDGNAALLGRAPGAYDLAWRSGTDQGAVVVGSDQCSTVAPVIGTGVSRWSSWGPPWNLNEMGDPSSCALRGYISHVGVSSNGSVVFVSRSSLDAADIDAPTALYDVQANGDKVLELAAGFQNVNDMAVVGDDVVLSAKHDGKAGLWRWVKATGAVQSLAEGAFGHIAACPDGTAVAAERANSGSVEVVEIDLP
jgi:hypothetical protein